MSPHYASRADTPIADRRATLAGLNCIELKLAVFGK